ncbi:MAG: hypothetical protein ACLGPM_07215 [Acidobacteriota bacterium]
MAANPLPRPVAGGFEQFDLTNEVQEAESRKPWHAGAFSRTLLKIGDMRLVMISMEPGARMGDHHADGSVNSSHGKKHELRMNSQAKGGDWILTEDDRAETGQ